jgi:hypothetical protein
MTTAKRPFAFTVPYDPECLADFKERGSTNRELGSLISFLLSNEIDA